MQQYYTRVGHAGGRWEWNDGWLVHNSPEVNEYLVKAKPLPHGGYGGPSGIRGAG